MNIDELYKKAQSGDAQAQYDLGICYESGDGVSVDYTRAAALFVKAAEQGLADARFHLTRNYKKNSMGRWTYKG